MKKGDAGQLPVGSGVPWREPGNLCALLDAALCLPVSLYAFTFEIMLN